MDISLTDTIFIFVVCLILFAGCCALCYYLQNPFQYPYYKYEFNVSGRRNVNIQDCVDRYLCDVNNWTTIQHHEQSIQKWKLECHEYLQNCHFRKYREKQYQKILDDESAYKFLTIRRQTRYRQHNYMRSSYFVSVLDDSTAYSFAWLQDRHEKLAETGYSCSLREYSCKNQRKLMTKELRKQIMERDNYTCQICGKYMPDEVGLQIDHIIPVVKGGKTIPSNLRVLCDKCNRKKGAKYNFW